MLLVFVLTGLLLPGCLGLMQGGARDYRPESSREELLFAKARRDVFPEDVRKHLDRYRNELLVWSGIVKLTSRQPGNQGRVWNLIIAHHYWDWIEELGRQGELAVLSPRGEGFFQCSQPLADAAKPYDPQEEMVIVYGYPEKVLETDIVEVHCVSVRSFYRTYYSTGVREYGRDYLLKNDQRDIRVLRSR